MHYQPQRELATGRLVGAEALLRWDDDELSSQPVSELVAIAEDGGLIREIGDRVLELALGQLQAWIDAGHQPIRMAFNLSGLQVQSAEIVEKVSQVLAENELSASLLMLEVTESTLMGERSEAKDVLRALDALGVRIALDDFGTGYSSLSYLRRFPIACLKIAQSFVEDLPRSPEDCALTRAILAMARGLGLHVIAEGVETQDQLDFPSSCGCDEAQGFLFGRPMPAAEFAALLESEKAEEPVTVLA